MKAIKKQGGFTLVEIAIVLVIIGLLLVGVLKGQELIENSKIKNIAKDMDSTSAAVLSYRDRYKGLPGDETINTATTYGWAVNLASAAPVGGNGLIGTAAANPFTGIAETTNAFRALRYSGFISGNPALAGAAALPAHAGGGVMAFGNSLWGLSGNVVCLNNLSGKFAGALDRLLDDGIHNTGSIRSGVTAAPAGAGAPPFAALTYQEGTAGVSLCKQL